MSVYSMTGFASAVASVPDHSSENTEDSDASGASRKNATGGVGAEIRSVNSRFLDLSFKVSDEFRSLEPVLRDLLTQTFKRGKIELRLQPSRAVDSVWPQPQLDQLQTGPSGGHRTKLVAQGRRFVCQRGAALVPCRCARGQVGRSGRGSHPPSH